MPYLRSKTKARSKATTENKGVTATGSDINDTVSSKLSDDRQQQTDASSLQNVRDELRNVIELMGPTTPQLSLNSSSEADNEDSYVASTSIYSSILQVKHVAKSDETTTNKQSWDTPRDISQISALPADSEINEPHNVQQQHYAPMPVPVMDPQAHHFACPCRQYAKHLQEFRSYPGMNLFKAKENYTVVHKEKQVNNEKFSIKLKTLKLFSLFKSRRASKDSTKEPLDLYKINILQQKNDEHSPPARLIFDRIEDIPKPDMNTVATNTSKHKEIVSSTNYHPGEIPGMPGVPTPFHSYIAPPKFKTNQKHKNTQANDKKGRNNNSTKFDVYYFDHGDAAYFKTTDCVPALVTEVIAEKTEQYTSRFWAEAFGTIHIGFAFFTSFILQLLRFVLQSLIRPLFVGITQLFSDYFFKPVLAVIFNGIIQPPLVFLYNIATSLRDLLDPIAEGIGYFFKEIAHIFRAVRLVEINRKGCKMARLPLRPKKLKTKQCFRRIV